jgi:hypothetical protein
MSSYAFGDSFAVRSKAKIYIRAYKVSVRSVDVAYELN